MSQGIVLLFPTETFSVKQHAPTVQLLRPSEFATTANPNRHCPLIRRRKELLVRTRLALERRRTSSMLCALFARTWPVPTSLALFRRRETPTHLCFTQQAAVSVSTNPCCRPVWFPVTRISTGQMWNQLHHLDRPRHVWHSLVSQPHFHEVVHDMLGQPGCHQTSKRSW